MRILRCENRNTTYNQILRYHDSNHSLLVMYNFQGSEIDSIDLKSLIVTRGVTVDDQVYKYFKNDYRLSPDPLTCNCAILPDKTVAQLTDFHKHMKYLGDAMFSYSKQSLPIFDGWKSFDLNLESGRAVLSYNGQRISEVEFPRRTNFYEQSTSSGLLFLGNAVLQGVDTVAFPLLWPCEIAREGHACQFCVSGGISEQQAKNHVPPPKIPTTRDTAEIVDYAVNEEGIAKYVMLDGGYTMNPQAECERMAEYLREIEAVVGRKNIREIFAFTSPPSDSKMLDLIFDAGADRVVFSPGVWDEHLAEKITPGQVKYLPRKLYMNALNYVAREYGPNKACSLYVIGVESAESFLSGAELLARDGVVPLASLWIPFGKPVMGTQKTPDLNYYRKIKQGLAVIYEKYGIVPPGDTALNSHIDRDVWRHKEELINSVTENARL